MKNKKIALLALGMLIIGAGASIAYQSHAAQATEPSSVQATSASDQTSRIVDQKDANSNDLETVDDTKANITSEKESANDNDGDAQSEQNEVNSSQANTGE